MPSVRVAATLSLLIECAWFLTGCAAPLSLPEYSSAAAGRLSGAARNTVQDGIKATLDPFSDTSRCKQYFGLQSPSVGFAILHVRIENAGLETWLLHKDACKLLLPTSESAIAQADTEASTTPAHVQAKTGTAAAVLFLGVPGLVAGEVLLFSAVSDYERAGDLQRNLLEKALRDKTLSPGDSVEGFLYFANPKTTTHFTGLVSVPLISATTGQIITLHIPVDYETQ